MHNFKLGDRVKHSEYKLRPRRDYWLSCGREPMKSGAKAEYDKLLAERGTVIEIKAPIEGIYGRGATIVVKIDGSNSVIHSTPSMFSHVE